jgi:hypothetical protein
VAEFYSSSVSKELKGEEETGRCRFSGGSAGGMTVLRFGSSHVEEGDNRRCTARRRGRRGSGADGSRRWEPIGPNWAVQTEWAKHSGGQWEEDDEGLRPANGPKGRDGMGRLLRLGRCRGKQRKWFGPGKRF